MSGHLDRGQKWTARLWDRKLFEEQAGRFFEISQGLVNGLALGRGSGFRIESHIATFRRRNQHSGQRHIRSVPEGLDCVNGTSSLTR